MKRTEDAACHRRVEKTEPRRQALPTTSSVKLSRRAARRLRHALTGALLSGATLGSVIGGCATRGSSIPRAAAGDDAGGETFSPDAGSGATGPAFTGDCSMGLKSIAITPTTATAQITYPQAPQPVSLKATGTFTDGSTMDVTGCAAWTTSAPGLATVSGGTLTPGRAGQFTVTVTNGSVSASATVTVKLVGTANAGNIDTTKLDGTPGGAAPTIAYPLDGALFPITMAISPFRSSRRRRARRSRASPFRATRSI